jgi:RNA polymerase sigma-70 factor, ECF subfamily
MRLPDCLISCTEYLRTASSLIETGFAGDGETAIMARMSDALSALEELVRSSLAQPIAEKRVVCGDFVNRMQEAFGSGQERWPKLDGQLVEYARYLLARLEGEDDPLSALAALNANDLFIAHLCAQSDSAALKAFEVTFGPVVDAALIRLRLGKEAIGEVKQAVMVKIFVAPSPEKPPWITSYNGRGRLDSWVRVIAVRTAGHWVGKSKKEVPAQDQAIEALLDSATHPELAHLKQAYRGELKSALHSAMSKLDDRQLTVLRQHYLDGLTTGQLGLLYGVDRSTISRWIISARETILDEIKATVRDKLELSRQGMDSVLGLLGSRLDMTLPSLLGDGPEDPAS